MTAYRGTVPCSGAEQQIVTLSARGFDLTTFRLLAQRSNHKPWMDRDHIRQYTPGMTKKVICYCSNDIGNQFIISIRHLVYDQYTTAKGCIQALSVVS